MRALEAALLGMAVGSMIDWPLPAGRTTRLRVLAVLYQPEAAQRAGWIGQTRGS